MSATSTVTLHTTTYTNLTIAGTKTHVIITLAYNRSLSEHITAYCHSIYTITNNTKAHVVEKANTRKQISNFFKNKQNSTC